MLDSSAIGGLSLAAIISDPTNSTSTSGNRSSAAYEANRNQQEVFDYDKPNCESFYESALITLTLPLWTFASLFLLLILIYYLRRIQYYTLYDRCLPKNAHFRYDFHMVVGKYSANYLATDAHLILDLLDKQHVNGTSIQIPGRTIFNEKQVFVERHFRKDLKSVVFTIYRRHPLKDVKLIRLAHNCNNSDSRIFVYALNLYDQSNGENKFFPVKSVIKHRSTHWALNTTFESKPDISFKDIGCDSCDPFALRPQWPTYADILLILFYIWCSVLFFGHLISVDAIIGSIALHSFVIIFISGSSAAVIAFIYLRLIKNHIVGENFENFCWSFVDSFVTFVMVALSLAFWISSTRQVDSCKPTSKPWMISSIISASLLSVIVLVSYFVFRRKRLSNEQSLLEESDNVIMKTNSKPNIEFIRETATKESIKQAGGQQVSAKKVATKVIKSNAPTSIKTIETGGGRRQSASGKKKSEEPRNKHRNNEETLENAFNSDGVYMKTKNRNSISQYV